MSFNKENKPDNSLTQENDPAMANIDISRMDSSGFIKVLSHNKPKRSRASSRSSSMRGNSPPPSQKKEIHKSVIQEKANIPAPKDWDEPQIPSEVKDLSTSDIPINDESVVKYESQFPALGEETPKTEEKFTPEILNPQTIVQTSILKEATDTSSAAPTQEDIGLSQSKASISSSIIDISHEKHEYVNEWTKDAEPEKVVEIVVPEEKVIEEYTSHFPALGTEAEEVHPQTEFTPEILEAEPKIAAENEGLEVISISQDKLHIPVENIPVERMREASADRTPKNSETDEQIPSFNTAFPSKIPLDQIPSGIAHGLATRRSPTHQDFINKNLPDEVPATFSDTMKFMETHIPLDEIPSGVAHGFASVRSPSHKDLAKKGIPDEVPATFSGTLESLRGIPPGTAASFSTTHIPLSRISGPISKGFASGRSPSHKDQARQGLPDEVPATFSGTVESFEPKVMGVSRIPLDQIVGGMAKGYNTKGSPSHKELVKQNIPDEVPATFSDTVEELDHEFMITPIPLDQVPINIARGIMFTKTPTHLEMMKMGLPDDVPATFSDSFALWEKSQEKSQERPTILEQKLESELEQEDQIIENKISQAHQKFIGKYQRIKQDHDLAKSNDSLTQSWEVIRTKNGDEENRDHTGYKPARVGEKEEAEGLLSDTDEGVVEGVVEEEEFGNYKTSIAKNRVEIKEEAPMQSVEENIVIPPESQNEGINMQDLIRKDIKEIERNELSDRGDDAKLGGEKSSLEHIAEDPNLANRSTELTLSSQRIDLIKEELKDVIDLAASRDPMFYEIERNLHRVKELEKSRMYGAAINLLKKSLEVLDARIARHDTSFDIREMNKLLIQCNAELAHCYYQVIDFRLSMQYARAALNLDPKNTESIYYLGAGQNKTGDFLGGYNTLKEVRRFGLPADNDEYLILIESEIQKFEKKVEEGAKKAELGMVSPIVRDLPKSTRTPMEDKQDDAAMALSNIGMFVGTGSLAGAASWMLSKNHFKLSEKKTFLYSLGIGALVGTASLALLGHFRKSSNKK